MMFWPLRESPRIRLYHRRRWNGLCHLPLVLAGNCLVVCVRHVLWVSYSVGAVPHPPVILSSMAVPLQVLLGYYLPCRDLFLAWWVLGESWILSPAYTASWILSIISCSIGFGFTSTMILTLGVAELASLCFLSSVPSFSSCGFFLLKNGFLANFGLGLLLGCPLTT